MRDQTSPQGAIATLKDLPRGRATAHGWMPKSGYGPYCTIPVVPDVSEGLRRAGVRSLAGLRIEAIELAKDYTERAILLGERAKSERLALATNALDLSGKPLIRPNRLRLCVSTRENYLYIGWRGIVEGRQGWQRYEAANWDCGSKLDKLIENASPTEVLLVRGIEAEAAEIRRRWFALVRMVYYLNVVVDHRLCDTDCGAAHRKSRLNNYCTAVVARVRRYLN